MTKKVLVERYIQQVHDGSHYRGHIEIAGTKFDYELVFAVSIPQLDDMEPAKDNDDIRQLFQLTVKRDNSNIDLSNEEYGFFFHMLVKFAFKFYNTTRTCDSQENIVEPITCSDLASIGVTSIMSYNFPPQLYDMLSALKFGCALTN